ncbi:uncharacterized protein LOC105690455 [Athalia rosae]|uniref:uncharacterized protein LOC105690455 n=1 Tax=Athalia rosae TaxID=37344 RepID=UPI00203466A9|nr:uncharacterized protein LOC105690455 [Athalia rosae]
MKLSRSMGPKISAELAELLDRLELSPSVLLEEDALAIDKNSSYSSGPGSIKDADSSLGYPQEFLESNTIDRSALLEEFLEARAQNKVHVERNDFFHDQLVKHFRRKEMTRVFGEPNEAHPLETSYLKKLSNYEVLREELESGEEEFKGEITILRDNLSKINDEADAALEELVAKERTAGGQCYANGKLFAAKEIQALINRQLAKMKEISKNRIRYARLRDQLVEKEIVFDTLKILTPDLDQKDYERLQAENFHFKYQLRIKEIDAQNLSNRRKGIL